MDSWTSKIGLVMAGKGSKFYVGFGKTSSSILARWTKMLHWTPNLPANKVSVDGEQKHERHNEISKIALAS